MQGLCSGAASESAAKAQKGKKKKRQRTAITCLKASTVSGKPIPHRSFFSTGIKLLRAKAP